MNSINNLDLWHIWLTHWNWLFTIVIGGPLGFYGARGGSK